MSRPTLHTEELSWYFADSDAATGVHGQGIEPSGGHVFDELASHRIHMKHRSTKHRLAVQRRTVIEQALRAIGPEVAVLRAVYEPHGHAFSSDGDAARVRHATRAEPHGSLLELVLDSPAAQAAADKAKRLGQGADKMALLRFFEWELAAGRAIPREATVQARGRLVVALKAYGIARKTDKETEEWWLT